jgi:hypothetical protein
MQRQKKITYKASPQWTLAAVAAAVLCVGLVYYWYTTSTSNDATTKRLNGSIRSTQGAVSGLSGNYSDQKAEQTRAEADKIRGSMMTGAEADAFISSLRPAWAVVARSETAGEEFTSRRYQIARGSSPVSIWPEVTALIDRMKETNSLAVDNIDVQTVGDSRRREFSRISLTLTVYVKKSE